MNSRLWKRALLVWLLFVPIAVANGGVRNYVYGPWVGELLAHQISTVTGSLLFLWVVYLLMGSLIVKEKTKVLWGVGESWVGMTILFEFGFGHYVMGHSWERLLTDYNLSEGRVWGLFLVITMCAPLIIKKLMKNRASYF